MHCTVGCNPQVLQTSATYHFLLNQVQQDHHCFPRPRVHHSSRRTNIRTLHHEVFHPFHHRHLHHTARRTGAPFSIPPDTTTTTMATAVMNEHGVSKLAA